MNSLFTSYISYTSHFETCQISVGNQVILQPPQHKVECKRSCLLRWKRYLNRPTTLGERTSLGFFYIVCLQSSVLVFGFKLFWLVQWKGSLIVATKASWLKRFSWPRSLFLHTTRCRLYMTWSLSDMWGVYDCNWWSCYCFMNEFPLIKYVVTRSH